jgi:hypothetical protein
MNAPFLMKFGTRLGRHYANEPVRTARTCFALCDEDGGKCAAASTNIPEELINHEFDSPRECFLFKYGFGDSNDVEWTSYVKEEIETDKKRLAAGLDGVQIGVRVNANSYDQFNELTPLRCFDACRQSSTCVRASFTSKLIGFNCFLFDNVSSISEISQAEWLAFRKS